MSVPYWPVSLPPAPRVGMPHAPQDVSTRFETDVGVPISRPLATDAPYISKPSWLLEGGQIDVFDQFFMTDLKRGSVNFAMRDATTDRVRMCKFLGAYQRQFLEVTMARIDADMMILPGTPWFAPYVPADTSRVPDFVADYDGGVYGIDGAKVAASALPDIAGEYLVVRTTTTATTEAVEVLTAGDIPATAPADTLSIVGFAT